MKAATLLTAALGAAVLVWVALTLPPNPFMLAPAPWVPPTVVRGVVHVHSIKSDGTGSAEDIAAAARRAGLDFVVLADHGDGTRAPDPPAYHSGVLCLDGVEISTSGGHYIALGLPRSPYPLGGEARDVVEDVRRLGGFGIVAHPDSPKPDLRWQAWDAPFDAIEWLNMDSTWRGESIAGLAHMLLSFPLRGAAAIASAFERPDALLAQWDELTRTRAIVALAGTDAHARFGLQGRRDPYRGLSVAGFPSYETSFRVFANRVELARPFSGSAEGDRDLLIAALRSGHAYTAIDGLGGPAALEFTATSGASEAHAGDRLPLDGPVTVHVRVNGPPGATIVLRQNGRAVAQAAGGELTHAASGQPAVYRVEVNVAGARGRPPVPWLVSNPIYVGDRREVPPAIDMRGPAATSKSLLDPARLADWHIEREPHTEASVMRAESQVTDECVMTYRLGPGEPAGQFAALVKSIDSATLLPFDRISFRARSDAPMRLSVQVRAPGGREGQRWQRSVYLDQIPRDVTVFFTDMRSSGPTDSPQPDRRAVDGLLFVVDTTNAKGGTAGKLWLSGVRLEK